MTTQQVWKKYADDVKHFILSKVKDASVTDDIVQETFIKVHTKLHTLNDITKLKSWIFTIARNTMMDYFKSTNQTIEFKNLEVQTDTSEHEHTEKDCLHAIIQGLPKKYRDPLFLSDIKGLKQQEIADTLKQNLPTTKSQIQRARKLIAQGFMDCCGFSLNEEGKLIGEIQDKEDCKVCK